MCSSCQSALDEGSESIVLSIDFSAAFDRVNHEGLLYKLANVLVKAVELANVLVGYADDSTLVAHVPHPSIRVAVVGTLNRDLESIAD